MAGATHTNGLSGLINFNPNMNQFGRKLKSLAPAVLASLYNDLSWFKKQIVDFKKCPHKFPLVLDVNVQSPFYLVQVWVWERFKKLQPQPKLINNGDHVLLRWHNVKVLKIDNVRLTLDSAIDDFIWRPYVVRYSDKWGMFYPIDEMFVPFKKDLDKEMLSLLTCLRVSELVGFDSIEQYVPHRVAMQFGFDQNVPGYVSSLNETQAIAWQNYTRPLSDTSLYFPSRFFKAGVTTCYAKWWKKPVLGPQGFVMNDMPYNRIACSSKHRPHAEIPKRVARGTVTSGKSSDDGSKTSKGDNIVDVDVPSDFGPKLVGFSITTGKSSDHGSKTSKGDIVDVPSVQDGMKAWGNIDADGGNIVDVPSVQDSMKVGGNIVDDADGEDIVHDEIYVPSVQAVMKSGGNIDDDVPSVQDGMKIGANIDVDRGNIVADDVPSGSIPEHLKSMSSENSVEDGSIGEKDVDSDTPSLPPKDNTLTPLSSVEDGEHVLEDGNESNDSRLSRDIIGQSESQRESYSYLSEVSIADLEQ